MYHVIFSRLSKTILLFLNVVIYCSCSSSFSMNLENASNRDALTSKLNDRTCEINVKKKGTIKADQITLTDTHIIWSHVKTTQRDSAALKDLIMLSWRNRKEGMYRGSAIGFATGAAGSVALTKFGNSGVPFSTGDYFLIAISNGLLGGLVGIPTGLLFGTKYEVYPCLPNSKRDCK